MIKTVQLLDKGFVSSSGPTPEFNHFFQVFKTEFRHELTKIGAQNIIFNKGHFYVSGFFTTITNLGENREHHQCWYFSISDVRGVIRMPFVEGYPLMYRTAKSYQDYTGGSNRWITIEQGMGKKLNLHP